MGANFDPLTADVVIAIPWESQGPNCGVDAHYLRAQTNESIRFHSIQLYFHIAQINPF